MTTLVTPQTRPLAHPLRLRYVFICNIPRCGPMLWITLGITAPPCPFCAIRVSIPICGSPVDGFEGNPT